MGLGYEKIRRREKKKMAMKIEKILSCICVVMILMSVVPVSVFAVDSVDTVKASNRLNDLEKPSTGNKFTKVIMPSFTNNPSGKYRTATKTSEDSNREVCVGIIDANMPRIYLNDTQESVANWDSGNGTILSKHTDATRENVSVTGCDVWVKINDDTCAGYCVYVDGVYILTEGQTGTPDGYCAFYVTAGSHTLEIRKNGRSASKTCDFVCGNTYTWVSMPDNWCGDGGSCDVWVEINDDTCAGYCVYVDGVYILTEGQTGTPDGYCAFYVTAGSHTLEIRKNGCSATKTNNFVCGNTYTWVSMPDNWCKCGGGDCDNPPTVKFDESTYYEGDTVQITVSTALSSVYYEIKDCSGTVQKTGYTSGGTISYTIPDGSTSSCCNWKICFYWDEGGTPPIGPAGYSGNAIVGSSYDCTKCYNFYVCPDTYDAYVIIEDKVCFGYEVYVDGVHKLTEGQTTTPDGYCAFYVGEGTHTIEIRKDGCAEIVYNNNYFQSNGQYKKTLQNYWCNCNKPDPEITKVEYPTTCVKEDEYATISVTVKNNGGASNEGYISVSFPNDEDVYVVSGTGNKYNKVYQKDDLIWNSAGVQMDAVDPLVELYDSDWKGGQQETITMNVKPNSGSDEIVFYVRAALKNDADGDYERDPTYSAYEDQQGWYAEKYSVDVCDILYEIKIEGEVIEPDNEYLDDLFDCKVKIDRIITNAGNMDIKEGDEVLVEKFIWCDPGGTVDDWYVETGDKV
ncbi:hypothetical protein C5S35_03830, partial [Candidatus Methanophagaceae archaeon]